MVHQSLAVAQIKSNLKKKKKTQIKLTQQFKSFIKKLYWILTKHKATLIRLFFLKKFNKTFFVTTIFRNGII